MRRGESAFTLFELLLALAIFSVLAAGLYGTVRAGVGAQRAGEDTTRVLQTARVSLDRIARRVRAAYVSQGELSGEMVGVDEVGTDADHDALSLVSASHFPQEDEAGEADLVRIRYFIDLDETTEESGLVEERWPIAAAEDEEPQSTEIAAEVLSLNFRYFDGEEWQESWDSTDSVLLPTAVEITIAVAVDPDDRPETWRRFTTVVVLPAAGAVESQDLSAEIDAAE